MKSFKKLKDVFVQEEEVFEQFIKARVVEKDRKIQLKNKVGILPLCTTYFHSRKGLVVDIVGEEKVPLRHKPTSDQDTYESNKIHDFYSDDTLRKIVEVAKAHFIFLKVQRKKDEVHIINGLVFEIVKISYLLEKGCDMIVNFLEWLIETEQFWKMLNFDTQKALS